MSQQISKWSNLIIGRKNQLSQRFFPFKEMFSLEIRSRQLRRDQEKWYTYIIIHIQDTIFIVIIAKWRNPLTWKHPNGPVMQWLQCINPTSIVCAPYWVTVEQIRIYQRKIKQKQNINRNNPRHFVQDSNILWDLLANMFNMFLPS